MDTVTFNGEEIRIVGEVDSETGAISWYEDREQIEEQLTLF